MPAPKPLISGFLASAQRFPERPALQIQDQWLSFSELKDYAERIAATLQTRTDDTGGLTGVFGHRSFGAFAGVLATLMCGDAYVPLNPAFPPERTAQMILRARLTRMVAERASMHELLPILATLESPITVVLADSDEPPSVPAEAAHHTFLTRSELADAGRYEQVDIDPARLAYLLFTSGSTGTPKGVMVTQANVTSFVDYMVARYEINETDRFSQTFDLTFDLSAFDMFVAWEAGACLCCPTQGEKLLPAKYVQSQNLTIWFSVPSTAILMKKLRMLKPDSYPTLRYSLFCGEALPLEVAEAFQQAAPGATLENLYGPTELTIACTYYRYDSAKSANESELGVVPIGAPYPGMDVLIVDEALEPVEEGGAGELLMSGPQLSAGYWEDNEKTAAAFVVPEGQSSVFYRTGDRVRRAAPDGPLLYLGRVDNQIKVQGYRVELGEIEALIRGAGQVDVAIAAGYPSGTNGAEGVIAFLSPSQVEHDDIHTALSASLPAYMQPRELITVDDFPLNANGKVDRKALMQTYLSARNTA